MQSFTSTDAALTDEYGIQIGRWEQYPGSDELPFGAMWCVVPQARQSVVDQHPEHELAVVVDGHACIRGESSEIDAPAGTAVLFAPNEPHTIINLRQDVPVRIMSVFWVAAGAPATN